MKNKKRSILTRSLVVNFFKHGKIVTTLTRAKLVKGKIEKIITKGKKVLAETDKTKALTFIRLIESEIKSNKYLSNVLKIAENFKTRNGGYLTISKIGFYLDGSIKSLLCPCTKSQE